MWFDGGYQGDLAATLTTMLQKYQPQTVVFGGAGISPSPLKWVGTESGLPPYPVRPGLFGMCCSALTRVFMCVCVCVNVCVCVCV